MHTIKLSKLKITQHHFTDQEILQHPKAQIMLSHTFSLDLTNVLTSMVHSFILPFKWLILCFLHLLSIAQTYEKWVTLHKCDLCFFSSIGSLWGSSALSHTSIIHVYSPLYRCYTEDRNFYLFTHWWWTLVLFVAPTFMGSLLWIFLYLYPGAKDYTLVWYTQKCHCWVMESICFVFQDNIKQCFTLCAIYAHMSSNWILHIIIKIW